MLSMDITYHYPPELMQLLIETIPRLCRSKNDVLLFFRGAGISARYTGEVARRVAQDRAGINKFDIVRRVLVGLNEAGEPALRERREVLRRVVEFEDFSTCWETDRLAAQGRVAEIRRVINVKDSFTRMNLERERERERHAAEQLRKAAELRRVVEERLQIEADLSALIASHNPQARGLTLEGVVTRLFQSYALLIREPFRRVGEHGEGVLEQIDGVIELDGQIYLAEIKWLSRTVSLDDVSRHLVRVYHRGVARGVFVSATPFSDAALAVCKEALQKTVVFLVTLEEIFLALHDRRDIPDILRHKIRAAVIEKDPWLFVTG
jgi:hypothetical protein